MRQTSLLLMDTQVPKTKHISSLTPWPLILSFLLVGARILALTTTQSSMFWTVWAIIVAIISVIWPICGIALSLGNVFVSLDDTNNIGLSIGQIAGACAAIRLLLQFATHRVSLKNVWRPSHFVLFAIIVTIMLSAVLSEFSNIPWAVLLKLTLIILLYLLIATYINTFDKLFFLQSTIVLCASLAALWTVGQSVTGTLIDNRAPGLVGNANYQAIYCAVALPLVFSVIIYVKSRFWRILGGVSVISIIGAVIATASRGGLVVLAISTLFIAITWGKRNRRVQGLLGILIVVIAIFFTFSDYAGQRLIVALNSLSEGTAFQTESRVQLVDESLTVWSNYPLFGVGAGNWLSSVNRLPMRSSGAQSAHVWPAQILAELGVIGFGCYIGFVVLCIRDYQIAIRMTDEEQSLSADIVRGFFASAIGMSLAWTSGNPYNQLWFELLMLGGVCRLILLHQKYKERIL